ncbi:hypothetical protein JCM9140_949 [Halalkalibacter wakoensis JCM 9140]|uniref:DUF1450 domain-containing protein n=1 Tax=Halalkalibacter wakoensis JCM 9140 TaxID=1236970 RepID=W4PYU2_9BACI|nr:DUF1450 domain-containing protein [Halalkalibacter wakoensis]GAE24981.1 hypothetical protein JCM9140_949 [Halalkalibacter wakoensis JCM 9140]
MKKVYFCKENEFKTKKTYKALKEQYPDIMIKRKGCLGKCKTCKSCPFSLVDGTVLACETGKELYKKLHKRMLKESV